MAVERMRRRTVTGSGGVGGGGVVAHDRNEPADYGEAPKQSSSSTLADIDAVGLNVLIDASEDDLLLVVFKGTASMSSGTAAAIFNYTVDGVVGFAENIKKNITTTGETVEFTDTHVVTAGEITGGQVPLAPQFATNAGTLNINERPVFSVVNLGPIG